MIHLPSPPQTVVQKWELDDDDDMIPEAFTPEVNPDESDGRSGEKPNFAGADVYEPPHADKEDEETAERDPNISVALRASGDPVFESVYSQSHYDADVDDRESSGLEYATDDDQAGTKRDSNVITAPRASGDPVFKDTYSQSHHDADVDDRESSGLEYATDDDQVGTKQDPDKSKGEFGREVTNVADADA